MLKKFLAAIFLFALASCASAGPINVAAAISLQESLNQIGKDFHEQTNQDVAFQFGASGTLATQIREGAPIDLFISADRASLDPLVAEKIADTNTRIIVRNNLVLIVPADSKSPPKDFGDLSDQQYKRIAIGEPRVVPAGRYAMQVLTSLNLADSLRDRLVFGANVRQVLQYVERGEADAGIVYKTDALQSGNKIQLLKTADAATHDPIVYPAGVILKSPNRSAAQAFLEYLTTEPAQKIFVEKGFSRAAAASDR